MTEMTPPDSSGGEGQPPDFLEHVVRQTIKSLREQATELYQSGGEKADQLAATSARVALWLAGMRPGGLRMLRLLSGYEVELTPQDPLGFARHLIQALVGEASSAPNVSTMEEAASALSLEITNAIHQVTPDITPFVLRALLWQECGPLLQEAIQAKQQEAELASRRGSGKRDDPPEVDHSPSQSTAESAPPGTDSQEKPQPPRIARPGDPEDDGDNPPPLLIFPGRR